MMQCVDLSKNLLNALVVHSRGEMTRLLCFAHQVLCSPSMKMSHPKAHVIPKPHRFR